MTAPSPRQPCSSLPPPPVCVWGDMYSESCADCLRCGFAPCACLRELRPGMYEADEDADDLELSDEVALGRLPFLFAPHLILMPRDQLQAFLPGVRLADDSMCIAEALIAEELGPDMLQSCVEELFEDLDLDELAGAVSNDGDTDAFAPEPAGHGWNAGGDTRCWGSNQRERIDYLLRRCEREPERRGRPVWARAARRAAGGLARRAKPQGEGT